MKTISTALCALFVSLTVMVAADEKSRPTQPAFKGVDLYSWQGEDGAWIFALLPGTNRRKPDELIKSKDNQIAGVEQLAVRFHKLAKGQVVGWFHRDTDAFTFPSEAIRLQVIAAAKEAEVEIDLPVNDSTTG